MNNEIEKLQSESAMSDEIKKLQFWEINVYAGFHEGKEVIKIEKTLTTWERSNNSIKLNESQQDYPVHWTKTQKESIGLKYKICSDEHLALGTFDENGCQEDSPSEAIGGNLQDYVYAKEGLIHFTGKGYLVVDDVEIEPETPSGLFGHRISRNKRGGLEVYPISNNSLPQLSQNLSDDIYQVVLGENIKLEISFYADDAYVTNSKKTSCLFYLQQEQDKGVYLLNNVKKESGCKDQIHKFDWAISNKTYPTLPIKITNSSNSNARDKLTSIRVSQDKDRFRDPSYPQGNSSPEIEQESESARSVNRRVTSSNISKSAYFECFSGIIPLIIPDPHDPIEKHSFCKEKKSLYIGYAPEEIEEGGVIKRSDLQIFQGTIGRVFFDPNSSCTKC